MRLGWEKRKQCGNMPWKVDVSKKNQPKFSIVQTYVKDVSFENPFFLDLMHKSQEEKPDIKFNLEIKINQGDEKRFEVLLVVKIDVVLSERAYIQSEIVFAALTEIVDLEQKETILFVDVPHQIYPEMRPIFAQLFSAAGSSMPLKLPMVDFQSLYQRRLEENAKAAKKQVEKEDASGAGNA